MLVIKLSKLQRRLYRAYLTQAKLEMRDSGNSVLTAQQNLMLVWNHPFTLYRAAQLRREKRSTMERRKELDDFVEDSSDEYDDGDSDAASDVDSSSAAKGDGGQAGTRGLRKKDVSMAETNGEANGMDEDAWWRSLITAQPIVTEESDEVSVEQWESIIGCSGKVSMLFNIIRSCEERGEKLLVFSQSIPTLDFLEHILQLDPTTPWKKVPVGCRGLPCCALPHAMHATCAAMCALCHVLCRALPVRAALSSLCFILCRLCPF